MSVVAWCEALNMVPEEWRTEFCRFVEDGDASEHFIAFLQQDAACRRACEIVLRADQQMARVISMAIEDAPYEPPDTLLGQPSQLSVQQHEQGMQHGLK